MGPISLETKVLAGFVFLALMVLGALWIGREIYDGGETAGKDAIQKLWDQDKEAIQAATTKQLADMTAQRDKAIETNAQVINDYEAKLSSVQSSANQLASRLRLALAAAGSPPVQQGPDKPESPNPGGIPGSAEVLIGRLTDYDEACQRDAAKLTALQNEIDPQIDPPFPPADDP